MSRDGEVRVNFEPWQQSGNQLLALATVVLSRP
jgi:hypothetical protein